MQLFLQQLAQRSGEEPRALARGAIDRLLSYSWPGNIRELRNVIERAAVVYATERVLREGDIVRALGLNAETATVVDLMRGNSCCSVVCRRIRAARSTIC